MRNQKKIVTNNYVAQQRHNKNKKETQITIFTMDDVSTVIFLFFSPCYSVFGNIHN